MHPHGNTLEGHLQTKHSWFINLYKQDFSSDYELPDLRSVPARGQGISLYAFF